MVESHSRDESLQPAVPQPFRSFSSSCDAETQRLGAAPAFAITSGKGGVGKTNVVANLAAALMLKKKQIMVIDANLGLANFVLFFGVKTKYIVAYFFFCAVVLLGHLTYLWHGLLLV